MDLKEDASKEEIRLISTITKELVNNIYKHSEASYIFIGSMKTRTL